MQTWEWKEVGAAICPEEQLPGFLVGGAGGRLAGLAQAKGRGLRKLGLAELATRGPRRSVVEGGQT